MAVFVAELVREREVVDVIVDDPRVLHVQDGATDMLSFTVSGVPV